MQWLTLGAYTTLFGSGAREDGDFYVHRSALRLDLLNDGDRVEFETALGPRGLYAHQVRRLAPATLASA